MCVYIYIHIYYSVLNTNANHLNYIFIKVIGHIFPSVNHECVFTKMAVFTLQNYAVIAELYCSLAQRKHTIRVAYFVHF